jgi:hypothetical protein
MRRFAPLMIILVLLSVGGIAAQENPTPSDSSGALQVVDTDPLPGQELDQEQDIRVYFDRRLDCATVAGAASISPVIEGEFRCDADEMAVVFVPDEAYAPATTYTITLDTSLQGDDGGRWSKPSPWN